MFPFPVVASCVPRMNKIATSSRSFIVVEAGVGETAWKYFQSYDLKPPKLSTVAETFWQCEHSTIMVCSPVLDVFEAKRTIPGPVTDSSEG